MKSFLICLFASFALSLYAHKEEIAISQDAKFKELTPKEISKASVRGCSNFKKGKFKYYMPDSTIVIVKRGNKYQYELYKGTKSKFAIKWIDECKYTLVLIKSSDPKMLSSKGMVLETEIYETNKNYYRFVCTIKNIDFKLDGIIYKAK